MWAIVLGLSMGSCAETPPEAGSAGPVTVHPRWGATEQWFIRNQPDITLTKADQPFGDIGGGVLLANGGIVLADRYAHALYFYDSNGDFATAVGGYGSGPGEFKSVSQVYQFGQDSIIVNDLVLGRQTIVAASGVIGRTIRPSVGHGEITLYGAVDDRHVVLKSGIRYDRRDGLSRDTLIIGIMDLDTGEIDDIARIPGPEYAANKSFGRLAMTGAPFARSSHVSATGGRICIGISDNDSITVRNMVGDSIWTLEHARPTPTIPQSQIDSAYFANKSARAREYYRQFHLAAPATYPAFEDIHCSTTGEVWVQRFGFPGTSITEWDVQSRSGAWLGTVNLEHPQAVLLDVDAHRVLVMLQDSLGVPTVAVHRIDKPSA